MLNIAKIQLETVRRGFPAVSLVAAGCTLLSACGGGDGGADVASLPPPPPPVTSPAAVTAVSMSADTVVIPSPATDPGTKAAIALIEHGGSAPSLRLAGPTEVRITNYQVVPNFVNYTIAFSTADLPGGITSLTESMEDATDQFRLWFGDRTTVTTHYSDGTDTVAVHERASDLSTTNSQTVGTNQHLVDQLFYSTGLSHVALGEWMWATYNADGNRSEPARIYFVNGDRTPAIDIPTSGTATYSGASLGYDTENIESNLPGYSTPVRVALTADFGQSAISAQLNRESEIQGDAVGGYTSVGALDVHGAGKINAPGDFTIPLSGTYGYPGDVSGSISTSVAATGSLSGAFFGPRAEQVGGVFSIGDTSGHPLVNDAFVALKN